MVNNGSITTEIKIEGSIINDDYSTITLHRTIFYDLQAYIVDVDEFLNEYKKACRKFIKIDTITISLKENTEYILYLSYNVYKDKISIYKHHLNNVDISEYVKDIDKKTLNKNIKEVLKYCIKTMFYKYNTALREAVNQ